MQHAAIAGVTAAAGSAVLLGNGSDEIITLLALATAHCWRQFEHEEADDAARLERSGAKAMLVGESLMRQADVTAATRALLGG